MLSKSKYVEGLTCEKMVWLELNKPEVPKENIDALGSEYGIIVGECAKDYFGKHIDIPRTTNKQMALETKKALEKENVVITEASFIYDKLFCSVDILVKKGNKYYIHEVKSKSNRTSTDMEKYKNDIAFQNYVLTSCGLDVEKCYLVTINTEYILKNKLNLKELFVLDDVTDEVRAKLDEVRENSEKLNIYISEEEKTEKMDMKCTGCPYFNYCFKDLPENNIFELHSRMSFEKKLSLYNRGIILKKDAIDEVNASIKQQIMFDCFDTPDYIDEERIKEFTDELKGDIYFLDFETFSNPIPLYDGDKANTIIPFQYSLHYYDNGELKHSEFLGDGVNDPRRELALSLVKDIPTDKKVLAYHKQVECSIIKNLADRFPDLSENLMKIHDNVYDLEEPFAKRYFYTRAMNGRSSIKVVLPALCPDLSYSDLPGVHKGDEATNAYITLKNMSYEEQKKKREELLVYCSLDTFAMVRILEELNKMVNNKVLKK